MDWRELHLSRRSRWFNFAHRWVKVLAILVGFPVTTLCLMAVLSRVAPEFNVRAGVAVAISLAVPAAIAYLMRPEGDPLVAVGLPSEMYALLLLGFAVVFVVALQSRTRSMLLREADRINCDGPREMALAAWWLGGVKAAAPRTPATCDVALAR
jgi:hypothetical protein